MTSVKGGRLIRPPFFVSKNQGLFLSLQYLNSSKQKQHETHY